MSKTNQNSLVARIVAAQTTGGVGQPATPVANDPRKTIQQIQSGAIAKVAINELNRSIAFANAVGQNFAAVLPSLSDEARIEVVAALACAAPSKDRHTIMEHALCPAEVEAIVATYDEKKTAEAEARKAERAAEREAKDRANYEELARKFGGGAATTSDMAAE